MRRLKPRDLLALGLVAKHAGRVHLTNGGVLLSGRDRERLFPDAYIQAGRFRGVSDLTKQRGEFRRVNQGSYDLRKPKTLAEAVAPEGEPAKLL